MVVGYGILFGYCTNKNYYFFFCVSRYQKLKVSILYFLF